MRNATISPLSRLLLLFILIQAALLSGSLAAAYENGDVNDDTSIDLKDAVLSLQVLSGQTPGGRVFSGADAD